MNHLNAPKAQPSVLIVGGGLAGITTALQLASAGVNVTLWEGRSELGGRAASYQDSVTGERVDHCQHVAMGCCLNFLRLCRALGCDHLLRRDRTLHFIGPRNTLHRFRAAPLLPAPLHLGPSFLGFTWLTLYERFKIASALFALARLDPSKGVPRDETGQPEPTMLEWLKQRGHSARLMDLYWSVVLVSALGDTIDRVGLYAARKVFVDGFMTHRAGYEVYTPTRPLAELFDPPVRRLLLARGGRIHSSKPCRAIELAASTNQGVIAEDAAGQRESFDAVVLATPWRKAAQLAPAEVMQSLPKGYNFTELQVSPITGVHLWYDRPLTQLPHAAFVQATAQWLFRGAGEGAHNGPEHHSEYYHQVVISASRSVSKTDKQSLVNAIDRELKGAFPNARNARLLRYKVITEQEAVFTAGPGAPRPPQATEDPRVYFAGDWTDTGWPATMEGAVISGLLAANAVAKRFDVQLDVFARPLIAQLPKSYLAKLFIR